MVTPRGSWNKGTLTGKKRVRRGWFGKLILQVEVVQTYVYPIGPHSKRTIWRDATTQDLNIETVELT